jgi:hypothetical protein
LRQLAVVRAELEACWRALRPVAPDYVRFRSAEPYSGREIGAWLDRQPDARVALLSLFCDDDGVHAFILRQGRPRPSMLRLPLRREELRACARDLRRAFNGDPHEFPPYPPIRGDAPQKRRLDFLSPLSRAFEPVWDGVGDVDLVCVAPHGPLHMLPLHALTTRGASVAERFALVYAPSLSVLVQSGGRPRRPDGPPRVLAAGVSSADDAHPEFFEDEAGLFDGTGWPVTEAFGVTDASKPRVMRALRDHAIVHVSCHGYFEERNPLRSGLVLSNGTSKAPRDVGELALLERGAYLVTADELMRAGCTPRLVTLSACSTGLQQVRNGGDELDGFSRALLLAGASSAVLGMWNLDQESSREFFRRFYRHLSCGVPRWRALNTAQREMLNGSREAWRHPYHWAPFYLIGDWRPL